MKEGRVVESRGIFCHFLPPFCVRFFFLFNLHKSADHFLPMPTVSTPRIPTATYRVQLHKGFTFNQAREIVPLPRRARGQRFVRRRPFFQASPGSTHGYDIVDHNHLNPEVGTPRRVSTALVRRTQATQAWGSSLISCPIIWASPTPPTAMVAWTCSKTVRVRSPRKCFDIDWHPLKRELEQQGAAAHPGRPIRTRVGERANSSSPSRTAQFLR